MRWRRFALMVFLFLFHLSVVLGQTAQLDGVVKDATRAVVPGAEVTLTSNATNLSTTVVSNDTGRYTFANLPPGMYTLAAELQGFKRWTHPNVILEVGDTLTFDVSLETGEISEEVVVSGKTAPVDRRTPSLRAVVDEKKIINLPLVGRDPMNLFFLQAGTNRVAEGGAGRVNGLRSTSSSVQVEGVAASDAVFLHGATRSIAPVIAEAISEYSVTTTSATVDAGSGSGALVQLVYKSGSNSFHGSLWEFHRNRSLNASDFFANRGGLDKPNYRRHQYGLALGGPIIKDRVFFHFTYENVTERIGEVIANTVWTDRFKESGIFQYLNTVSGQVEQLDLKTIDPSRTGMAPEFSSFAALLPSPNDSAGDGFNTATYRYSSEDPFDRWQAVLKADYIVNDKNRLGVALAHSVEKDPTYQHILGHPISILNRASPTGLVSLTTALTPTFLNEARFGLTSSVLDFSNGFPRRFETAPLPIFNSLGGPDQRGRNATYPIQGPQHSPTRTRTLSDNITWIRGDHTFKFGLDFRWNLVNQAGGSHYLLPVVQTSIDGNPSTLPTIPGLLSNDQTRARQLINDVTGTLGSLQQDFSHIDNQGRFVPFERTIVDWRSQEYSLFFQDTWKLNDRLTLLWGTRYDVFPAHYLENGVFGYPLQAGRPCVSCILGISGSGETRNGALPRGGREMYDTDWNNFAPNIGLIWDPWGNGKTTLAANYRISYDRVPINNTLFLNFSQEGSTTTVSIEGLQVEDARLANAEALSLAIDPGEPFGPKPFNRDGIITVWDPNYYTPYVQGWSFRVQRELMRNTVLELAYVGNHAVGEPRAPDLNQLELRENGFLAGFIAAQANYAANGDPLVGADTGVFGQIWAAAGNPSSLWKSIEQGKAATIAEYIDDILKGAPLAAAGFQDNFFRVNPQFENAYFLGNYSHSTYHGFRVDVRRRFTEGLQFQANYAFGKGLTDWDGGFTQRNHYRDNANPGLDKSRSTADATHIVNANFIYELPFGRGRRWGGFSSGLLEALLGGWQVNGIFSYSSGQPVTIQSGGYNNLTVGDTSTVTFSGTDPGIASSVNTSGVKNPNAFTSAEKALFSHPTAGSAGLTAQRFFEDASFWVLDSSLFKSFATPWFAGEDAELQFRFEFFNTTNSTRFEQFNNNFFSPTFGDIGESRDARIMQVALKFIF